jgi:hypothetical protein
VSVAKKFEIAGKLEVFKGTVQEVTELRKRRLYAVVYEDGDGEDLNETEFREACELFISLENSDEDGPDSDDGKEEYNSDIEISEYELRRYIFEPNGEKGVFFMNFVGRVINLSK